MATIFGVTVTFALPENDTRRQNDAHIQASDGTFKYYKYRTSDRILVIPLRGLSTTTKNSLATALEGDADKSGTIAPDSHVDLGGGVGTSVTARWIDPVFDARKTNHEKWDVDLTFVRTA
jgi:hypothetical protein